MSLATLAVIYGYLMERNNFVRVLLALASLPIAVAANSLRVVVTGLLVQYWDPDKAQGFFHEFQGWLMFVALASHAVSSASDGSCFLARERKPNMKLFGGLRLALAAGLIVLTAILLQARGRTEIFPPRLPLRSFPMRLDRGRVSTGPSKRSPRRPGTR